MSNQRWTLDSWQRYGKMLLAIVVAWYAILDNPHAADQKEEHSMFPG